MEERIIDEEYGRGIKLKKTKDGYVDATDELAAEREGEELEAEGGEEEVVFEFPDLEEDDEELATLTPEEARALKQKRAEEAAKREAEYARLCAEGNELLEKGEFERAEAAFDEATTLTFDPAEAEYGLWSARTERFAYPERLADGYADDEIETMSDLIGARCVQTIAEKHGQTFKQKIAELEAEEKPLAKQVAEAQESRRAVLAPRLKKAKVYFAVTLAIAVILFLATIGVIANINTRPDSLLVYASIGAGAAFFLSLVAFIAALGKFLNELKITRENETLHSTDEGERLEKIRFLKEFYSNFID